MPQIPLARESSAGSCRHCPVFCERLVYLAGCIESGCPRLYAYDERGRRYVGCLEKVFSPEVDLELFERAQESRGGFGGLRAHREPLPVCRTAIERTFAHRADGGCVNPDFLLSEIREAFRVSGGPRKDPEG